MKKKRDFSKTGKCLGMGIFTTMASENLNEAWWSLDRGDVETSKKSLGLAAENLRRMERVNGKLGKEALKIKRNLAVIDKSFPEKRRDVKIHGIDFDYIKRKKKAKKGMIDSIIQVHKLREAIGKDCGFPQELVHGDL